VDIYFSYKLVIAETKLSRSRIWTYDTLYIDISWRFHWYNYSYSLLVDLFPYSIYLLVGHAPNRPPLGQSARPCLRPSVPCASSWPSVWPHAPSPAVPNHGHLGTVHPGEAPRPWVRRRRPHPSHGQTRPVPGPVPHCGHSSTACQGRVHQGAVCPRAPRREQQAKCAACRAPMPQVPHDRCPQLG
jgi:hypothetical protein